MAVTIRSWLVMGVEDEAPGRRGVRIAYQGMRLVNLWWGGSVRRWCVRARRTIRVVLGGNRDKAIWEGEALVPRVGRGSTGLESGRGRDWNATDGLCRGWQGDFDTRRIPRGPQAREGPDGSPTTCRYDEKNLPRAPLAPSWCKCWCRRYVPFWHEFKSHPL